MTDAPRHASHPAVVAWLKPAEGQPRSVIAMIDLARQRHAGHRAIANAKSTLVHDDKDHCLDAEACQADHAELRDITRYI